MGGVCYPPAFSISVTFFHVLDDQFTASSHLVCVGIVEEVGPVWICLHEPELKQLPETQLEDVERDLEMRGEIYVAVLWSDGLHASHEHLQP